MRRKMGKKRRRMEKKRKMRKKMNLLSIQTSSNKTLSLISFLVC